MVGNKHKNGIICTFPDCNKPMRTQKFKMHFTKAHLKEGEAYSVEHRRQYEVAREDSTRTDAKVELVPATIMPATNVEEVHRVDAMGVPIIAAHEDIQTAQSRKLPQVETHQASHGEDPTCKTEDDPSAAANAPGTVSITTESAQTPLSAEQTSGSKRPASAMEAPVDPTSVLLMQFIALMDQRFQELVGKMGEMIDVQKDLIDTLQASNPNGQAPASAFSHAVEVVMKRRKKSPSNHDNSDSSANSNDSKGGNQDGFVL
ncbi:Phosphatidylinositol 4-kinase beta [Phytophthora cinnamomi]|uniref:Phosphatidylinositol 4-kinase beta n=1 Tax=Phytophthora cinnamomi TaxID=4785 RepID=UPI00355A46AC|nr:Phosphatidylinositol 4-kinase beta [Phytophthora cinnamomi]